MLSQDTIFALSSGRPPAGVAVFRMSGPMVRFGLETLIGYVPADRRLVVANIANPVSAEVIDRGLAVFFPGPASFTGEDAAELHIHGGRAVVAALTEALGQIDGFRLATPGEFARRAFERGKLDLAAVEGLADLVAAETEMQRRQALRQAGGALGSLCEAWRHKLIRARAMIEAELDFSEEEDVPRGIAAEAFRQIAGVREGIAAALRDDRRGERLRDGLEVVILGAPNAGKSSLLNALARREAAIVSAEPGTTRDLIEVRMDLDGFPLTLIDTAGIRCAESAVEREGVQRAKARAALADVSIVLTDASVAGSQFDFKPSGAFLRVATKIDLLDSDPEQLTRNGQFEYAISVVTGAGIDGLVASLARLAAEQLDAAEPAIVTRQRHRFALTDCLGALDRTEKQADLEVVAEELRTASDALARIVGRIDVEDWLDVIFSEFCIGK